MTILLPTDDAQLFAGGTPDEHGWVDPSVGQTQVWQGRCSLQLIPGATAIDAGPGGGEGPFDPMSSDAGFVYLPVESGAVDGMVLVCRGKSYVLRVSRYVADPMGIGIDCLCCGVVT
jgi:hypothetical protein